MEKYFNKFHFLYPEYKNDKRIFDLSIFNSLSSFFEMDHNKRKEYLFPKIHVFIDMVTNFYVDEVCKNIQSQYLYGEEFIFIAKMGDCYLIQSLSDFNIGYVKKNIQYKEASEEKPNSKINIFCAYSFEEASIKKLPVKKYLFASKVNAFACQDADFKQISNGYIPKAWLIKQEDSVFSLNRFLELMHLFLYRPYLWGGKTAEAIDCSGILQLLFYFYDIAIPRDSDQQANFFRKYSLDHFVLSGEINEIKENKLQKGDIIIWDGHIAIMLDGDNMIHANATYMKVTINNIIDFSKQINFHPKMIIRPDYKKIAHQAAEYK